MRQSSESRRSTPAVGAGRPDAPLVRRLTAGVAVTGEPVATTAPFTGDALAVLPQSTAADVADAFAAAREAQRSWAALPARRRAEPFLRLHDVMLSRWNEILDLLQWENGKARHHAMEELMEAASSTLYAARQAPGPIAGRVPSPCSPRRSRHPTPRVSWASSRRGTTPWPSVWT
nr:aldehyde dehydrogenase family protein [Streptomyces sp. OV198]